MVGLANIARSISPIAIFHGYIFTTSFLNPDEDPHVLAEIPLFLPAAAAASQLLTSLSSRYFSHLRQVHVS